MGPFALAVPAYRLGLQQHKRKKQEQDENSQSRSPSPEVESASSSSAYGPSSSINPRSHSPDTLRQFAVAGLSPEEDLPSNIHPKFPHKSLPEKSHSVSSRRGRGRMAAVTSGSEADVDTAASESRQPRKATVVTMDHSSRIKHINTLTAIMHRCLHEGDIPRAKRAFGLLVRTKEIDIRLNNMWTMGTEILMRDGEEKDRGEFRRDAENTGDEEPPEPNEKANEGAPPARWGSASNLDKVKQYIENLIQQHPYDPLRPRVTSAINFWPALFSIEIYNVDAEHKRAVHRLDQDAEAAQDDDLELPMSPSGFDGYDSQMQRKGEDRKARQWAAKDEVRRETHTAAQQIATRMDQVMENVPFSTHHEMLRLRGMLALYIGDLCLSSRFVDKQGLENQLQELSLHEDLRQNAETFQDKEAIRMREGEVEKARKNFGKILEKGGMLEPWLRKFVDEDDEAGS